MGWTLLLGTTNLASSIHLYSVPNDNQIELFWTYDDALAKIVCTSHI